jgi:hypothetical protein
MAETKYVTAFPHLVISILAYVFVFHTYGPDFYNDSRFSKDPFWWFCIWAGVSLLPTAQAILDGLLGIKLFSWEALLNIVGATLLGMWIWGFVIIDSGDWDLLKNDYHNLYAIAICYQVFTAVLTLVESGRRNN